jgi:CubicO group peptidase (beta-lactamase class C family)
VKILPLFLLAPLSLLSENKTDALRRLFDACHEAGQFEGAVLVAEQGEVVFKSGYGYANREWSVPNTPSTKFRIASVTKQFTAAAVLQLVHEGKLELNGRICDYIPEYPAAQGRRVTIHQLLNHTSGIPSYTDVPGRDALLRERRSPADLVKLFWKMKLDFQPGARFAYNNSGYVLLGWILERVTGQPYPKVLEDRIFVPLGMRGSGQEPSPGVVSNRASGYRPLLDGFAECGLMDTSALFATGSLYSTVEDLCRWDQALYTDRVLPGSLRERMFQGGSNDYGYGWRLQPVPGSEAVMYHEGSTFGFQSLITRHVGARRLVVLLSNAEAESDGPTQLGGITSGVFNVLNGRQPSKPKEAISRVLGRTWKTSGIAAALRQYHELKAAKPDDYDFSEPELNRLGYWLLQEAAAPRDAIEVFQLNAAAYPASAKAYRGLAAAYMAAGEKERAVAAYKKAVRLKD